MLTVYAVGPVVNQRRFQNAASDFVIQEMILEVTGVRDHAYDGCLYVLTVIACYFCSNVFQEPQKS